MQVLIKTLFGTFVVLVALAGQPLRAGEFGGGAEALATAGTETAPQVAGTDAGVGTVYEAQAAKPSALFDESKTAVELLEAFARDHRYNTGWDSDKKRFFAIQYSAFNVGDPAADRDFLAKREIAAKNAILTAKVDVIRFVATEMSAADQFETPGTDVYAALNQEYEDNLRALEAQRREVAELLALSNEAEAAALAGATTRDRINALLETALAKLGADFDAGKIAADKRAQFDRQKAAYLEAKAQYDNLLKQAETLRCEAVARSSSVVSMLSQMPLAGATVIQQAESWNPDSKQYEVAVLLCWSAQLELAARATLTNEPLDLAGAAGKRSVNDWLNAQDLGAMIGPRQFLDDRGRRHFLGITARPVLRDAVLDRRNRGLADAFATQMAVFSLFADVRAATQASQATLTTTAGDFDQGTITRVVESLQESMTQSFEKMQIHGLQPLHRARVKHALTGQDMHVSVYGINAQDAAAAMQLQEESALNAIRIHKDQAFKQGRNAELQRQVEASKNDAASRAAGAAAGRAAIAEPQKSAPANAPAATPDRPRPMPAAAIPGAVAGGTVADDF